MLVFIEECERRVPTRLGDLALLGAVTNTLRATPEPVMHPTPGAPPLASIGLRQLGARAWTSVHRRIAGALPTGAEGRHM